VEIYEKFGILDANSSIMQFTENFRQALQDYIFLLEKKYPEKTVLDMVATRHSLNHFERSILYRGVATKEYAQKRKLKLVTIEQLSNGTLHIDLFNVLFTIAAYLRGHPVYIAMDDLLRDASESHGKGDWEVHLDQALDILLDFLKELPVEKNILYLDNPLEYGLAIAEKLRNLARHSDPRIHLIADPSPDHLIKEVKTGVLATSDSTIIDKSPLPVVDLALAVLTSKYEPKIARLEEEAG
jgi:hypothetical protein